MNVLMTIMSFILSTVLVFFLVFMTIVLIYFTIDCIRDIKHSIQNIKQIMKEGSNNENKK